MFCNNVFELIGHPLTSVSLATSGLATIAPNYS